MEWIRLFNPQELQRLIGGEGGRAIDVEDLKRNTLYAGGYHQSQPVMQVCVPYVYALYRMCIPVSSLCRASFVGMLHAPV